MFGKLGRAITKPLHMRAHSAVFKSEITTAIDISLKWWKRALSSMQHPRLTPSCRRPFCVSLSDGESTPIVGAALWYRDAAGQLKCKKTRCLAPSTVPGLWSNDTESADHINAVEALGPLLLLCTFNEIFRGSLWVHYIENGGALGCIVNGHSDGSKIGHSLSSIAAEFWHRAAHDKIFPWLYYVPSDLNIMDGYSHGEPFDKDPFGTLAEWSDPQLPPGWIVTLSKYDADN